MNIEQARFNMIEQQIRPWNVLNNNILNILYLVKREEFVPKIYKNFAFFDIEIPLPNNENMLLPKIEARILQEANIKKYETVLEIGAGSGYMAALLAHNAKHVTTIEINPELELLAKKNLFFYSTVNVELGNGIHGWKDKYDVIVASGSLPFLTKILLEKIKIGGRILAIIGTKPIMTMQVTTRVAEKIYDTVKIFELLVKPLHGFDKLSYFSF